MPTSSTIGRVALGVALAAFGVENLVTGRLLPELQHAPASVPAVLAYLDGALLVGAGACLVADRHVVPAARAIVALLALWLIAFYAPELFAAPRNGGLWTGAFEVVAIAGAAALLGFPARPALGRVAFACALLVFALMHVIYIDYVASVIPGWIPAHVFWGYATGLAHAAGGLALLVGIRARLAAILLAVMFGSWVVILHLPRALAAGAQRPEWTSLCVALAMTGGSLLLITRSPR